MEITNQDPLVKYEGSPQDQVPPSHVQERQKVIDGIRSDGVKNPDIHFSESPHFIVVFRDNQPYEDFDAPGFQGPEDLAYYLEGGLKIAIDTFGIQTPDTFQVVRVERGGRMRMTQGTHHHNQEGLISIKNYDHARFNKVKSRGKTIKPLIPLAYTTALHEAVGHGVLAPGLLSDEGREIPFLNEGLSTYIEHLASGRNPHDYLISEMHSHALSRFQNLWGKWKEMKPEQIAFATTQRGINDLSVANLFKLTANGEDVTKRDYASIRNGATNYADYSKGGSFTKYLIDKFGIETYKRWVSTVTRAGFVHSLEQATGLKLEELERGWKQEVLRGFMTSPEITGKIETSTTTEDQVKAYEDAKRVRDIYLVHS